MCPGLGKINVPSQMPFRFQTATCFTLCLDLGHGVRRPSELWVLVRELFERPDL